MSRLNIIKIGGLERYVIELCILCLDAQQYMMINKIFPGIDMIKCHHISLLVLHIDNRVGSHQTKVGLIPFVEFFEVRGLYDNVCTSFYMRGLPRVHGQPLNFRSIKLVCAGIYGHFPDVKIV